MNLLDRRCGGTGSDSAAKVSRFMGVLNLKFIGGDH